jgi:putative membrane protein insertion efficiency factor
MTIRLSGLAVQPIRVYRWVVSPLLPVSCRYQPTCSAYAIEALERQGLLRGLMLTAKRLLRCQPWSGSGYDPVPHAASRGHAHSASCNIASRNSFARH